MGAFLLISDEAQHFRERDALDMIGRQCGTPPRRFTLPGWVMYLFPKRTGEIINFREDKESSLFVTGTPFFSNMTYKSSIDKLWHGLKRDISFTDELKGLFFVLEHNTGTLRFYTDPGGIYSLFHSADKTVISSSFLALCTGLESLTPDRDAITENLVTGSVTGSDTVFTEIRRFDPCYPVLFSGLEYRRTQSSPLREAGFKSRQESIKGQIEILDEYFTGLKPFAEEAGTDGGITGGFDSRLLLSLERRHFDNSRLQFHSHFRHKPDTDFITGETICRNLKLEFKTVPYNEFSPSLPQTASDVLTGCMLFTDGQVRTHSFWHEEFNTSGNRIQTFGNKRLGLSGIGGEQYRNSERIFLHEFDKVKWIKHNLIRKPSDKPFITSKTENDLIDRLNFKLSGRLDYEERSRIDLFWVKRYMNEIYIPANRGLRAVNENRLAWSLLPFADYAVSRAAYLSVPFLGRSLDYEAEMINAIDPEAAATGSGYGFAFNEKEPLHKVLPFVLFENFLPCGMKHYLSEKLLVRNTDRWADLVSKTGILTRAADCMAGLSLPVNLQMLTRRKDTGPLVFAMGFLMDTYKNKIR